MSTYENYEEMAELYIVTEGVKHRGRGQGSWQRSLPQRIQLSTYNCKHSYIASVYISTRYYLPLFEHRKTLYSYKPPPNPRQKGVSLSTLPASPISCPKKKNS